MTGAGFVTNPSLYAKTGYDPIKDFEPVSLLWSLPTSWWCIRRSR